MKHQYYSHYAKGITIPNYVDEVFIPWVIGSLEEQRAIEKKWKGVHNFTPSYRKECYPEFYFGEHPEEIEESMPELQKRLDLEIECEIEKK